MAASQRARLLVGLGSTGLVMGIAAMIWGRPALTGVMARTGVTPSLDNLRVYGMGVLFRLTGVIILGVTVALDRTTFAPLASATGYLGTVLPLLYLETRLSR